MRINSHINYHTKIHSLLISLMAWVLFLTFQTAAVQAADSVCARVKIAIDQELTLERQAFDARMTISNGLSSLSIEDIGIDVWFTDEQGLAVKASSDPDDTDALFYINIDSMDNIDDISGSGSVSPETAAKIHWLIIPAADAAKGLENGATYAVGATLTYTIGGEETTTRVEPDYITVKPMPALTIDYFLPSNVYGDDPFTDDIEPSTPFTLGVRVKNTGAGRAANLSIDSAQPRITENDQGLLINFVIEGTEINGVQANDTLCIDFGTIEPGKASVARWIMSCSLSGTFVEFNATFSHSDELGGELTSLVQETNTHFLVHDVRADLSDSDDIGDFLAKDDDVYRIYESSGEASLVEDRSPVSGLTPAASSGSRSYYTLTTEAVSGFSLVTLSDPENGTSLLSEAVRSDGKIIKAANVWQSKIQNKEDHTWSHYINLFDVDGTASYTLAFDAAESTPRAPVLQYIPDRSGQEGEQLSFLVEASDPDGTIPMLSAGSLPAGAAFVDNNDGTGVFAWTPETGQNGIYSIVFTASDGQLTDTARVRITIRDSEDSDDDGMSDSWELIYFGTLDRDGTGDYDNDGVLDFLECLNGMDPLTPDAVPGTPEPVSPLPAIDVTDLTPDMVMERPPGSSYGAFSYEIQVYRDESLTDLAAETTTTTIPETELQTTWTLLVTLEDNTWYYWRVRAFNSTGCSLWAYSSFLVNTENNPPGPFFISSPADGSQVDTLTPTLEVTNSSDVDFQSLEYRFEVFRDEAAGTPVTMAENLSQGTSGTTSWTVTPELSPDTWYSWRATATDEEGSETITNDSYFLVNTGAEAPGIPSIVSPEDGREIPGESVDLTLERSPDAGSNELTCLFEIDTCETFDTSSKQSSGEMSLGMETTSWQVNGLEEDTTYYWRARTSQGDINSRWAGASFFVNQVNSAPAAPTIKNPGSSAWVASLTPTLSLNPVLDEDNDTVSYRFELYEDPGLTSFIIQKETTTPYWTVAPALSDHTRYYWRAQAVDEHGLAGSWTSTHSFFVDEKEVNEPPIILMTEPSADLSVNSGSIDIQWEDSDPDSSALIGLYYDTEQGSLNGTLIVDGLSEDPDGTSDSYQWDISGMDEKTVYLYAVINDEESQAVSRASGSVTIDRTAPELSITPPEGEYTEPQTITASTDEPAQIYYTADGTEPDTSAERYTGPIQLDTTTTLTFMAVDSAGNQCGSIARTYTFGPRMIRIQAVSQSGTPFQRIEISVLDADGKPTGITAIADSLGKASFDPDEFSEGDYQFCVEYAGIQFCSATMHIPDDLSAEIVIPVETVGVAVQMAGGPASGIRVQLISETGEDLGIYRTTDDDGNVWFDLPTGFTYQFQVEILGQEYGTGDVTVIDSGSNTVDLDTGGGQFQVIFGKDSDTPLPGVTVSLSSASDELLGPSGETDSNGQAAFDVPEGDYRARFDYLGYPFWSDIISVSTDTSVPVLLPHVDTRITVSLMFQEERTPLSGLRANLFRSPDSDLGVSTTTDDNGQAVFSLPEKPYIVMVNYLGMRFQSPEFTALDTRLDIASGKARIRVTGSGLPVDDMEVLLLSDDGTALDRTAATDSLGQAEFLLPEGTYRFQVVHDGSRFTSAAVVLAADQTTQVEMSVGGGEFTLTVQTDTSQPIQGALCHVCATDLECSDDNGATDTDGQVFFNLPDGDFQFRVDYLGGEFWSGPVNIPDQLSATVTIAEETVQATVTMASGPVENSTVYVFSGDGTYHGRSGSTNSDGQVFFDLPAGATFRFKADISGMEYWSSDILVLQGDDNRVSIDAGGGQLTVTLKKEEEGIQKNLEGASLTLFTADGTDSGLTMVTDRKGRALVDLPGGDYTVRADWLGYPFRSEMVSVVSDTAIDLIIPHTTVDVSVTSTYQGQAEPVAGALVCLCSPDGSDLGVCQTSGKNGTISLSIPDNPFKLRADYMEQQFWSDLDGWDNSSVTIPMAKARITVTKAGNAQNNVNVYVFSDTGTYLNMEARTDKNGSVSFSLPSGNYRFRTDYRKDQFWTGTLSLEADQETLETIELEAGSAGASETLIQEPPGMGRQMAALPAAGAFL